jgi:hypothetical protein
MKQGVTASRETIRLKKDVDTSGMATKRMEQKIRKRGSADIFMTKEKVDYSGS